MTGKELIPVKKNPYQKEMSIVNTVNAANVSLDKI
jgi:hypothetical protein